MAGRGRLGRVDDFGAAGLRDQIGQIMLRQGGALSLAVVRGCFDVAAVNGDTREADASTAEELGIALDEEGNVVAGDHEQDNDEGDENDDGMPNEPDQALFFLQGKVLTSWEHSKAALDACWSECEAELLRLGLPQGGIDLAKAEWDRQAADCVWAGDNHPRTFFEWVNNDYGCCSGGILEMFARP